MHWDIANRKKYIGQLWLTRLVQHERGRRQRHRAVECDEERRWQRRNSDKRWQTFHDVQIKHGGVPASDDGRGCEYDGRNSSVVSLLVTGHRQMKTLRRCTANRLLGRWTASRTRPTVPDRIMGHSRPVGRQNKEPLLWTVLGPICFNESTYHHRLSKTVGHCGPHPTTTPCTSPSLSPRFGSASSASLIWIQRRQPCRQNHAANSRAMWEYIESIR